MMMEIQAVNASRRELIYESNFRIFIPTSKHNENNFFLISLSNSGAQKISETAREHDIIGNVELKRSERKRCLFKSLE